MPLNQVFWDERKMRKGHVVRWSVSFWMWVVFLFLLFNIHVTCLIRLLSVKCLCQFWSSRTFDLCMVFQAWEHLTFCYKIFMWRPTFWNFWKTFLFSVNWIVWNAYVCVNIKVFNKYNQIYTYLYSSYGTVSK